MHGFIKQLYRWRSGNFEFFKRSTIQYFLLYIGFLILFFIYRIIHFIVNADPGQKSEIKFTEILQAFLTGGRFDTTVIFYGLLPLMLLSMAGLFVNLQSRKFYRSFFRVYSVFLAFLFSFFLVVDIFFYQFFHSHINVLIFAFIEDDTSSLLHTFWTDYPVILITIGLFITVKLFAIFTKTIEKTSPNLPVRRKRFKTAYILSVLGVYFVGMRGSVTGYPIRMDQTDITDDPFINSLACNGIFALKDAIKEYSASNVSTDYMTTLKKAGFNSPDALIRKYMGAKTVNNLDSSDFTASFMEQTKRNIFLEENPPKVVFILAESMGAYPLTFHDSLSFNLLGSLENELPHCLVFDHFIGSTPSTIGSLEYLTVGNIQSPLAQSPYRNIPLKTSVAYPYKMAGYKTSFMTGGKLSWRKTGYYLRNQYFDEVIGYAALKEIFTQKEFHQYGSYDEYLYQAIFQKLKEARLPQFVFALTITNHTPYSVPSHYQKYPLHIPEHIKKHSVSSEEYLSRSFTAFQYANDQLGKFIHKIRTSPMGENTIIAVTGDHNVRKLFNYTDEQLLQKYGVSFILYIPEKYRQALGYKDVDTGCFGSHKDIFPTLFNASLSEAKYFNTGDNLLSSHPGEDRLAIYGQTCFMGPQGCVLLDNNENKFFVWKDDFKTKLKAIDKSPTGLITLKERGVLQVTAVKVALQQELSEAKLR